MLGSAERRKVRLISVKLFSKNSNACDHNPPTLQTDGQTDRQLIMAIPRYATLRAVKSDWSIINRYRTGHGRCATILCTTGAYEMIRSVRVVVNRQCHISSTNAR